MFGYCETMKKYWKERKNEKRDDPDRRATEHPAFPTAGNYWMAALILF